jgi:hypothetical protein
VVYLRAILVYHHYMMSMLPKNPISFDRPATYQISVQGRIDPAMSDLLGGMTISPATVEAHPPVTTLEGELRDQSALAGVLNALYELHMTVLFVKRLDAAMIDLGIEEQVPTDQDVAMLEAEEDKHPSV